MGRMSVASATASRRSRTRTSRWSQSELAPHLLGRVDDEPPPALGVALLRPDIRLPADHLRLDRVLHVARRRTRGDVALRRARRRPDGDVVGDAVRLRRADRLAALA